MTTSDSWNELAKQKKKKARIFNSLYNEEFYFTVVKRNAKRVWNRCLNRNLNVILKFTEKPNSLRTISLKTSPAQKETNCLEMIFMLLFM